MAEARPGKIDVTFIEILHRKRRKSQPFGRFSPSLAAAA